MQAKPALSSQLRSILHTTDFSAASEHAFAHGLKIALAAKSAFTILHTGTGSAEQIDWNAFPGVRGTLERWSLLEPGSPPGAVFKRLGVAIRKVDMVNESPVEGIVDFIAGHPCNLIVLATHGRDGLQRWMHRSVAGPVARAARVPALFLPQGARGFVDSQDGSVALRRILLPIDHEPRPDASLVMAAALSDVLADSGAELTTLHVGTEGAQPAVHQAADGWKTMNSVVRQGAVIETILDVASELDADLIVMTTEGRQGFLDVLRGSTTEQVLRRADRPVLAVPAG